MTFGGEGGGATTKTENVGPSKSLLTHPEIFEIFTSKKLKIRSPEQHVGNESTRTQCAVVARFRRVRTKYGFSPWFLNARAQARIGIGTAAEASALVPVDVSSQRRRATTMARRVVSVQSRHFNQSVCTVLPLFCWCWDAARCGVGGLATKPSLFG